MATNAGIEDQIKGITERFDNLIGILDRMLKVKYENKVARFTPRHLSNIRTLLKANDPVQDQLNHEIEFAIQDRKISDRAAEDRQSTGLIRSGNLPGSGEDYPDEPGPTRYVVVEISITADQDDLRRAAKRAAILSKALETGAIPAAITANLNPELENHGERKGVHPIRIEE